MNVLDTYNAGNKTYDNIQDDSLNDIKELNESKISVD